MTAPIRNRGDLLPTARTQEQAPGDAATRERQLAWQRAMERAAQPSAWLHHDEPNTAAPSRPLDSRLQQPPTVTGVQRTLPPMAPWVPIAHARADVAPVGPALAPEPDAPPAALATLATDEEAIVLPPAAGPARTLSARAAAPAPTEETELRSVLLSTLPPPAREGLRLHAEWSDEGVRLWVGTDHQAPGAAAALVDSLRRGLSLRRVRLLSIVCNGRLLWSAPAFPLATKELP